MKKIFALVLTLALALSLTACGGGSDPAPASTPSSAPASSAPAEGGEMSAEQSAVIDDYNAMVDEYNAVLAEVEANEDLMAMEEVTSMITAVTDTLNSVADVINESGQLSDEKLAQLQQVIDDSRNFTAELSAMVANYSGQTVVTISMQLGNDTGVDIFGLAMSPSGEESWGGNLLAAPLANGEVGETTMNITAESLVWDLMAMDSEGNTLEFYGLDFSEVDVNTGAQILLSVTEGGEYVASFVA